RVEWYGATREGGSQGRALARHLRSRTCSAAQIMYGTSDPLVGYAYRRCFRSVAGTPDRIARANRLITSSACGPSKCAPTIRSVLGSTITLNIAHISANRRFEYQPDVSSTLERISSCCARAWASVRPTPASGGIVNTTLGMPR